MDDEQKEGMRGLVMVLIVGGVLLGILAVAVIASAVLDAGAAP